MASEKTAIITQELNDILLNLQIAVGSVIQVNVTYIHNPDSFYVRPRACLKYIKDLETVSSSFAPPEEIKVGDVLLFESIILNKFIRGRVLPFETPEKVMYHLFALDYGFMEAVEVNHIRKPNLNIDVPLLIMHCRLSCCIPANTSGLWTEDTIELMKDFAGVYGKIKIIKMEGDLLEVDLATSETHDMSLFLCDMGKSALALPSSSLSRDNILT